ncbi:Ig-like domain-containing protein [Companilactobacillus huachuanensis]|uniref:Ig-like domain-containing protein n=1 Tax=Companilactobacillus huachuanensis TaxID=2559914 RepID=A0ABW1RMI5_9LACO|nr:Ig-like domain-containing protein [Companilactobacillus huachuanensis]
MKRKIIILILINLAIVLAISVVGWSESRGDLQTVVDSQTVSNRSDSKATVKPQFTPTSDPIIILFFWLTSGYNLQPSNQYTSVNKSKTFYTNSGRSFLASLLPGSPHYTWYKSDDGVKWSALDVTDRDLTVTPTKVGTVYYQQKTDWYLAFPTLLDTIVYSKMAFLTAFPNAIDATKLTVTADSNYLYNNQSQKDTTFARAEPEPSDSTGDITWSSDNTDLATVNKNTGLVTANNSGNSGTVKITGTIANNNEQTVSDTVAIRIGGGLDSQVVNEGEDASFEIQGHFDQKPTTVVWHKVSTSGKDTIVDNNGNDMSYNIKTAAYSDTGSKYYAIMTIKSGDNVSTIMTNQATLTVIRNIVPNLTIANTVFNNTRDNHNDENTILNEVSKDDNLTYKVNFTDANPNSEMMSGVAGLKIPRTFGVTDVQIDGVTTNNIREINDPDDSQGSILIINYIDFSKVKNHVLVVDGTMGDIGAALSYTSNVEFYGLDSKGDPIIQINGQPDLKLNFANKLLILTAHNWQYQTVNSTGHNRLLRRIKMAGNALDVSDNRTEKNPSKLYLIQNEPLKSGNEILNSEIRYYKKDGSFEILTEHGTLVEKTADGDTVQSISWGSNEGPLLYIDAGKVNKGNYSTELEWSLVQSV